MQEHYCKIKYDVDHLAGHKLTSEHYDFLVGGEHACDVYKPDGSPLVKYRPGWFNAKLCQSVMPACRKAARTTNNRGLSAGMLEGEHTTRSRVRKDGKLSRTNHALPVASGIIGFFDRNPRFPFCRQTSFNMSEAASWKRFLPYIERADAGFREHMPDRWQAQKEYAMRTSPDWVIPQSTFTTVTVNRNFQTATHKDAGDLKAGFGVMSCLRNDRFDGAYLVFPAFRVAVDFAHGSLCLADVHEWHSNTAISNMRLGYERMTLIFYYRENMVYCKSASEEVARVKHRKQGDSLQQ